MFDNASPIWSPIFSQWGQSMNRRSESCLILAFMSFGILSDCTLQSSWRKMYWSDTAVLDRKAMIIANLCNHSICRAAGHYQTVKPYQNEVMQASVLSLFINYMQDYTYQTCGKHRAGKSYKHFEGEMYSLKFSWQASEINKIINQHI